MMLRSGGLLFPNANEATLLLNERTNSGAVIVFRLIRLCKSVRPNWSTKTENKVNVPFQGQFQFPKQMFTDVVFLSSETSASAIKLFNATTGLCSVQSSLKAKGLVWPLPSCVTSLTDAWLSVMSL